MDAKTYYAQQMNLHEYWTAFSIASVETSNGAQRTIAKESAVRCYACCICLAEHHDQSDAANQAARKSYITQANRWQTTLDRLHSEAGQPQVAPVSNEAQAAADAVVRLAGQLPLIP